MVVLSFALFLLLLSSFPSLRSQWFAKLCNMLSKPGPLDDWRCGVASKARGNVLELGSGPGTNFRCYDDAVISSFTGIEPNSYFSEDLQRNKELNNLTFPVNHRWLKGEDLDVDAGTFDFAVGTHVPCSVESVSSVLWNVDVALKDGGTYAFMEHVSAERGSWLRFAQELVSPVFTIVANDCRFRDVGEEIQEELVVGRGYECEIEKFDGPVPLVPSVPHIRRTCVKGKKGR